MVKHIIKINHYTKTFKKTKAVNNIIFNINSGTIHGIIGPNGAGKTTIIKGIIGAYKSSKNQIVVDGYSAGSENANSLIGYIPERSSFPKHLNCIDYLVVMARMSGLKKSAAKDKANEIIKELGLINHYKKKPYIFFQQAWKRNY